MTGSASDEKSQKTRGFLIGIMMNFLISVTVFAIGTYYFVIPRLLDHERRLSDVRQWAKQQKVAQAAPAAEEAAAAPAGDAAAAAPAPAAPAAPAAAEAK
jgi:hypothetical protein